MIASSGELVRELQKTEDGFITILVEDREYIIDTIQRKPNYEESVSSHIVLICRDGGNGYLRR